MRSFISMVYPMQSKRDQICIGGDLLCSCKNQREDHRMGIQRSRGESHSSLSILPGICASCSFVGMMTDRFFTPMAGISPFKIMVRERSGGTLERNSAGNSPVQRKRDQGNTLLFEIVNAKLQAGKNVGFSECR